MAGDRKDPAFLFYATAWLQSESVRAMTLEARGAYIELLSFAWLHGSIPSDPGKLAAILGVTARKFAKLWMSLGDCWTEAAPGRLTNDRQESEREERRRKSEQAREKGRVGGSRGQAASKLDASRGEATAKQTRSREQAASQLEASRGEAEAKPSTTTTSTPSKSPPRGVAGTPPRPDDVGDTVWSDWLKHRRAKRATVSETVLAGLRREAGEAGVTLQRAMELQVANGWQGFRADWVRAGGGRGGGRVEEPQHPRNTPIGVSSCRCVECVRHRERRAQGASSRSPQSASDVAAQVLDQARRTG